MRLLYLDSSALVKLVVREPETAALLAVLRQHTDSVSSALARVEVLRAVARVTRSKTVRDRALAVLERVALVTIDDQILEAAAALPPTSLRSLDAIHLATVLELGPQLEALVCYDQRLCAAAGKLGLAIMSPE